MVVILQWLTAEWPGRSAFTGVQTVVIAPPTSKWEIAALSMFTTLVVHRAVTTATAAVTNCFPRSPDELQVLKKIHFLRNNPCVKYQHVCTIEKSGFLPWSWMKLTVAAFTEAQTVVTGPLTLNCDSQQYTNWMLPSLLWQWLTTFFIYHDFVANNHCVK